ncbi:MAG TPA: M23 family metallopeptidase [Gammaproteobacteria bacterium]|nr:M23 family metallopeptidase [Gammaproteobacteria bacterium]
MSTRSAIAALALLVALPAATAAARESCSASWVCIEAIERDDVVDLFARNLKPHAVTVSLRARARNLKADGRNPATRTISGHSRVRLLRLSAIDESRDWEYRYFYDWAVGSLSPEHDATYLYRLPFAAGGSYRVVQGFGTSFTHNGLEEFTVDFDVPEGTPVHAAREGVVARVEEGNDRSCFGDGCGRFANYVVIVHPDGTTGEYYHLQKAGALVEAGQPVRRGQRIGLSGNTGNSTMPHLHFGVYRADTWGRTQSLPFRFVTRDGIVERPRSGRRYGVG